jgi:hypothetical protein
LAQLIKKKNKRRRREAPHHSIFLQKKKKISRDSHIALPLTNKGEIRKEA